MESSMEKISPEIGEDLDKALLSERSRSKGWRRLTDSFAIIGPILQQPRQFFLEIRAGIDLPEKIGALFISSTAFLAIYGAMLGSGHPMLSLNVALAMPFLFLGSLVTCIPVMYFLDVLTGSQRSLTQIVAVMLTALTAAATVFFSFAPTMVLFNLTGTLLQFFWLNVGILAMATLVGLLYMVQGIIQTATVDPIHTLSKVNQLMHLVWVLLFLTVITQMAWWLLQYFQKTGGFVMVLIRYLVR